MTLVASYHLGLQSVADLEGVQGVRSNPPLEPNYSIFMENLNRFCLKLSKRTPLLYI